MKELITKLISSDILKDFCHGVIEGFRYTVIN